MEDNVCAMLKRYEPAAEVLVVEGGAVSVVLVLGVCVRLDAGAVCVGRDGVTEDGTSTVVDVGVSVSVVSPPVIVVPVMGMGSVINVEDDDVASKERCFVVVRTELDDV